ncbi:MAG: CapA family protein [Lachnospiraceae bacterium]|nr:CapA family protein [Lachnospiraceae bacterium]
MKKKRKNIHKPFLKSISDVLIIAAFALCPLLTGCSNADDQSLSEIQTITPESAATGTISAAPSESTVSEFSESAPSESTPSAAEPSSAESAASSPEGSASQLTLLMVGDILLHTPVEESALQADGTYNFDAIFAHTTDTIQAADVALVNQEVIIGGEALGVSGYPAFNAPYTIGDALADAGFDIVCHATNHALDKGAKGIVNCSSYWRDHHPEITVLGIHDADPYNAELSPSDRPIYFYTKDDITVAILNYTYGTNGIPLPSDMPYAVDLLDEAEVTADIRYAEEQADFTIVCPHWGTEYLLSTDSMQEKWTEIFLKNGVDLVLGTHPHVIEPIEWVEDPETGRRMLVYYSLGNFVNWTSGTGEGVSNRMVGGMAEVTLTKTDHTPTDGSGTHENSGTLENPATPESSDTVVISDYGIKAVVCHVTEGTDGVTVYPLADYTGELAKQNAILSQAPDFSLDYCTGLCNNVWGDAWH